MDGNNSKFFWDIFDDYPHEGDRCLVINRDRYMLVEAMDIFKRELGRESKEIAELAGVRWGAGTTEDGEKRVGWWLDLESDGREPRRCPVWVMI